jgi:uncharacterized glyoxalase superfamily protein PhnB
MLRKNIPMIFPEDTDETIDFYRDVLGFTVAERDDEFAELRSGNLRLWLHDDDTIDDEEFRQQLEEHERGVGVNLCFEVDDLDKYYERVVEKGGAPIEVEPRETDWGTRRFTVQDPSGYHLRFFSFV